MPSGENCESRDDDCFVCEKLMLDVTYGEIEKEKENITSDDEDWWRECYVGIPTPKTQARRRQNEVPTTLAVVKYIQNFESKRLMRVLFDSGGSHSLIHSSCLPPGACPSLLPEGKKALQTIAGTFQSQREVYCKGIALPEFNKTRSVDGVSCFVFDAPCNYDIILGRDFLSAAGVNMNFEFGFMEWMESKVEMKEPQHWKNHLNTYYALNADDIDDDAEDFF